MRKVTIQTVHAFINRYEKRVGNTYTDGRRLILHGNEIAHMDGKGHIYITTAGWDTKTTRERLNGIPGVWVTKKRGELYLNGHKWDGSWTCVNDTMKIKEQEITDMYFA